MGKRANPWDNDREIMEWAKETGRKGYTGNRSRDTMVSAEDRRAYYDDQMKDYDNRKAMETWNFAVDNPDFMDTLDKKDQKRIKSYMDDKRNKKGKGGEKDGQIIGISNLREWDALRGFQKSYHKNTKGAGGAFSSANDRGGNTDHMTAAMRDFLSRDNVPEEASNNLNHNPQPALSFNQQLQRGNISEKVLSAMDRVNAYEEAMRNGNRSPVASPVVDEQVGAPGYDPVTSDEMNKRMNFLVNYQFTPNEG